MGVFRAAGGALADVDAERLAGFGAAFGLLLPPKKLPNPKPPDLPDRPLLLPRRGIVKINVKIHCSSVENGYIQCKMQKFRTK